MQLRLRNHKVETPSRLGIWLFRRKGSVGDLLYIQKEIRERGVVVLAKSSQGSKGYILSARLDAGNVDAGGIVYLL